MYVICYLLFGTAARGDDNACYMYLCSAVKVGETIMYVICIFCSVLLREETTVDIDMYLLLY